MIKLIEQIGKNKQSKRICFYFLSVILVTTLFLWYGSYTKYAGNNLLLNWVGLFAFCLVSIGGLLLAWSGFRLWPRFLSSTTVDKEIYKKMQENQQLTDSELQQYNYNEMLQTGLRCSLIVFFIGLIILVTYFFAQNIIEG